MYPRSYCFTIAWTRLRVSHGGFGSRPAKNMLYSASSCLRPASSRCSSRSVSLIGGTAVSAMQEEPDQRQPQRARVRHRPVVNQHFGQIRSPDQFEQSLQLRRIGGEEARAIPVRGTRSDLAVLRRRTRQLQRAIEVRNVEPRERQRDRERTRLRPEQRVLQIRIDRDQVFVGRLLRQVGVGPEALERSVRWSIRWHLAKCCGERIAYHLAVSDLRAIPSIEQLRQRSAIRALEAQYGAAAAVDALRAAADAVRKAVVASGQPADAHSITSRIEQAAADHLDRVFRSSLRRVINASGVVLHTNLGRAPLAPAAIDRIRQVAGGYSSLEYDLTAGGRGRRDVHAEGLLCRLTGAESAVVVNNNAAATMIVLAALAAGREVVVSRGELVEIGGGFRVPDVMAQSGAILREVGTTNKTRVSDYAASVNARTALILRVHPSNFRIEGFTERPALSDLVDLGKKCQVPVAEDLGS